MNTSANSHQLFITLDDVLQAVAAGQLSVTEAEKRLSLLSIQKIGEIANLDVRRTYRTGVPEAILARGKEPSEVIRLATAMAQASGYALITRVESFTIFEPNPFEGCEIECNPKARTVVAKRQGYDFPQKGTIGVLSAGTADISVAEEATVTARVMGCQVIKEYDVGVAGVHRLYAPLTKMVEADVGAIVAVAGMDAVLPILVASQVSIPVVGVPTSVGYGIGQGGIAALMAMLQSCSPGLVVVNIDNGFGAGVFASLIARRIARQ